jgi:hypothetical protein
MKKRLPSLAIRERNANQSITLRFHLSRHKKQTTTNDGEDMEKRNSYRLLVGM